MLTKFSNFEDFFTFLEGKRAEIQADFLEELGKENFEMTKEEEEIVLDEEEILMTPALIKHSVESELIQIAWSTSFETPKTNPKLNRTDTTMIMEQLNLEKSDFDLECFDDLLEIEPEICEKDIVSENFIHENVNVEFVSPEILDCENNKSFFMDKNGHDSLELDSLSFPMSQFTADFPDEIEDEFIDEFYEISDENVDDKNERKEESNSQNSIVLDAKDDKFDFDLSSSQFPASQNEEIIPVFMGFKTGKGNFLPPPSKEAMKRARSLVELGDREEDEGNNEAIEEVWDEVKEIQKNNTKLDEINYEDNTAVHVPFPMFTTGKGKFLPPPSEEAVKRARNLTEDFKETFFASESFHQGPSDLPSIFPSFSTAKGKSLPPPSKEAMDRALDLIVNDPNNTNSKISLPLMPKSPILKLSKKSALTPLSTKASPGKPFPLSTAWKRPRNIKPVKLMKIEPQMLFDLNLNGIERFKLKDFFKKSPNLSIKLEEYEGIHRDILFMDSDSAKTYKFPTGWGIREAHEYLIQNGAKSTSISLEWTENHYRWIIWKFSAFIRVFPELYSLENLSPGWVLSQLIYRYEREINSCHRSSLKKIIERDDAAGKFLCLMVANINFGKQCIELSDGWYSIWTTTLDQGMMELINNKRIYVGMKIEISGASLTGQDPIPALEASNPDSSCKIVISRNSCRPSKWDTKLGFIRAASFLKHLHQIHPQGGQIPAVSVIIDRVFPQTYREERFQDGNNKIIVSRSEKDHFLYLDSIPSESSIQSKFTLIQRIRVHGNTPTTRIGVFVTFWNAIGEDQKSLLQEGTAIIITNLRSKPLMTNTFSNTRFSSYSVPCSFTLSSTKSTRLFKDFLKTAYSPSNRILDLNSFETLEKLNVNETIDLIGISLGKIGNYFWISGLNSTSEGANNSSNYLVCIKNFTPNYLNFSDCVNFRDLTFNFFDQKVGVAHFNFTDLSDFKRNGKIDEKLFSDSIRRFRELTK